MKMHHWRDGAGGLEASPMHAAAAVLSGDDWRGSNGVVYVDRELVLWEVPKSCQNLIQSG